MIAPRGTRPVHYEDIERQLIHIFRSILFDPIVSVIKESTGQLSTKKQIFNSPDEELVKDLKSGTIQYAAGVFSGKFRSATSKALISLGAKWAKQQSVFKMDQAIVPGQIKAAAANYQTTAQLTHKSIITTLDDVQKNLDDSLEKNKVNAGRMVDRVAADFHDVAKALSIQPTISPESGKRLADDYTNNMKLWIKKWCEEEIVDLRGRVEKNAMEGLRFDQLIDMIQNRYNVSESKAAFLARQETSLFVSKFNEERVKDAGINSYRWSTSRDERVRHSHKDLDGTIQFYDSPPIVDQRTGRRANPGEDFNCRCVPIPILKVPIAKAA